MVFAFQSVQSQNHFGIVFPKTDAERNQQCQNCFQVFKHSARARPGRTAPRTSRIASGIVRHGSGGWDQRQGLDSLLARVDERGGRLSDRTLYLSPYRDLSGADSSEWQND